MKNLLLLLAVATMFVTVGCKKDGPLENAGEKVDEAVHDATH